MSGRMKLLRQATGYDHEEAYFFSRDQELIAQRKKNARSREHLKLLPGGKSAEVPQLPVGTGRGMTKKAA